MLYAYTCIYAPSDPHTLTWSRQILFQAPLSDVKKTVTNTASSFARRTQTREQTQHPLIRIRRLLNGSKIDDVFDRA